MANDTISRQAAIDSLEEPCKVPESWTDEYAVGARAQWEKDVKALNSLSSAERHGRWIKKYRGNYLCSVCGAWFRTTDEYGNIIDGEMWSNYCDICGAKMENAAEQIREETGIFYIGQVRKNE